MSEVVSQLSRKLVEKGHEVTVATSANPDREPVTSMDGVKVLSFDISGNLADGINGDIQEYRRLLCSSEFDIVTNFAAQQWATDVALENLVNITAKRVFVPTGFSGLYSPEFKGYFDRMKDWMKLYDANVYLSDDYRDINFAKENGIGKNHLIPNGAAEEEFLAVDNGDIRTELNIGKDEFIISHIGSHTGKKGHLEAIEIFNKAKIKNTHLLIIGKMSGNTRCLDSCQQVAENLNRSSSFVKSRKKITICELQRKSTIAALKESKLFLFPSNIECSPIVLFEAMASRTPFLVTDVGNAKEIIKWTEAGELLPTVAYNYRRTFLSKFKGEIKKYIFRKVDNNYAQLCEAQVRESALQLEALFYDSKKRTEYAEKGFDCWQKSFTWERIVEQYESLYQSLVLQK
jgi:glycosyltransferase involved in cell wall biosynthesis